MAKKKDKEPKPMTREMMQMENAKLFEFIKSQNFESIEELNAFLEENVMGKRIDEIVPKKKGRKSNKEKSDELMYDAYENEPEEGIPLAQQALQLNPDNIRAIIYIADFSDDIEKAVVLYKQALDIGEKELGKDFFEENKGHFWAMHETRPYMTARMQYAQCLLAMEKFEEAIKEFEEMLELNPNDNQGVRYELAKLLLHEKKYDAYSRLHREFKEEKSTVWLFNYALFLFATEGPSAKTTKALKKANKENEFILKFLTGQKEMTKEPDGYYSPGDEREATYYLMDNFVNWYNCDGALEWVMGFAGGK